MKKRIFIIGAGGLGRGIESYLEMIPIGQRDWELEGFIDESLNALDGMPSDYKILGDINTYSFGENDRALIAIGDPKTRENVYQRLRGRVQFFTFIDPRAIVGKFTNIEEGCIVLAGCFISNAVNLGKFSVVLEKSIVGHDSVVGEFCSLMPNVDIGGGCKIGDRVLLGTNSTIIPRRTIVDNVVVGAGSVVVRNFKNPCTVFGNPAKKI